MGVQIMAFCTECGTLMHQDDVPSMPNGHVCNPDDMPEKGKPIKKGDKKV